MPDIIKTIEAYRDGNRVLFWLRMYNGKNFGNHRFIFNLGRGRPKRAPERLWFTFKGVLLGSYAIEKFEPNAGQYDRWFSTMFGDGYKLRPDNWLAVCLPPFEFTSAENPLNPGIFHEGFQGWRYFDFESYRKTPEAMTDL